MEKAPKISTIPLIRQIASAITATEVNGTTAHLPKGTVRGVVKSVLDPKKRGRVLVEFDAFSKDIPQVTGAGEFSSERIGVPQLSHWIDVAPAFSGYQPFDLVGTRVSISVSNGELQYAVLDGGVLYDPQVLTDQAAAKLKMPTNSVMTRLPLYPSGKLPPAVKENHGCMVIEMDGPLESDWVCVCLKRQGSYYWVRHVDLAHGHAGENDGKQPPDTDGDGEQPVNQQTIWDYVFPTTGGEMQKYSQYGISPRPNPFGGQAKWYAPPKSL